MMAYKPNPHRGKIRVDAQLRAVRKYHERHPEMGNFNGITCAALLEYYPKHRISHQMGVGFFKEKRSL